MDDPAALGDPPPPTYAEYLAFLAQTGSRRPPQPATLIDATPNTPTPPTQPRSFDRPGRGTGGALSDKQKVSKQITAPATKRKSALDPDVEIQLSPTSGTAKSSNQKKAKRVKTTKVSM